MKTAQWTPYENAAESAAAIQELLSVDGEKFGYAYGPGLSTIFGSARGGVAVTDSQWITVNDDGTITVTHKEPVSSEEPTDIFSYFPLGD